MEVSLVAYAYKVLRANSAQIHTWPTLELRSHSWNNSEKTISQSILQIPKLSQLYLAIRHSHCIRCRLI